ncbi:MAG: polysaccharide biosynthesis/export family protein [Candidatus Acidiferrales bacterium]
MMNSRFKFRMLRGSIVATCGLVLVLGTTYAQSKKEDATAKAPASKELPSPYVLGPDDEITVRALDVDEIDGKVARIDRSGNVDLPLVGKIKASGLSITDFESALSKAMAKYVRDPHVSVIVSDYKSQPVSVLGAVNTPGVYNLTGPTTLAQVLSRAGGIRNEGGSTVNITRSSAWGPIPLPTAKVDPSGEFSTADVSVKKLMDASSPRDNILVKPTDVVTVPRADLVYVVGAVNKAGGFVLNDRGPISVLQAVSLAEGLQKTSAPKRAKIVRGGAVGAKQEIPVNLSKILSGSAPDVPLLANDILFVPNSGAKTATYRVLEAAIQTGTGVAIFH